MTVSDQAENLRHMTKPKPVRVIAVTSGKGGVGKTNVAVNLAISMARVGHQVMLMDADLGLANIDVMLGLKTEYDLSHVIEGKVDLEEILIDGPEGIKVVPASSGTARMAELSQAENAGLIRAFSELSIPLDTFIIDTAAGIHDSVVSFAKAAREVVVVVCDEPTSITDAYAMLKVLNLDHGVQRFHVLSNMVRDEKHGQQLYMKLMKVANHYLDVTLDYMGHVPMDEKIVMSVRKQRPIVLEYPGAPAALALQDIAKKAAAWPIPKSAEGHLEFFVERLIKYRTEVEGSYA